MPCGVVFPRLCISIVTAGFSNFVVIIFCLIASRTFRGLQLDHITPTLQNQCCKLKHIGDVVALFL